MDFKRTFTVPVPDDRERRFQKKGIDTYHGRARFTGEKALEVRSETCVEPLEAQHVLLANGAKPAPLPFDGSEHLATSTDFLELDRLPERLVFVGGGYVSMELAHLAARAGAEVTVLHRGPRPLENFEPGLVDVLTEHTRSLGIRLCLETTVTGVEREDVEREGERYIVHAESGGEKVRCEADLALHGAGRVPDLDDMDLGADTLGADTLGPKPVALAELRRHPDGRLHRPAARLGRPHGRIGRPHGRRGAQAGAGGVRYLQDGHHRLV